MSDYQYFEFRAVDERLDERQMAELRELSRRAKITPTSFRNSYNWGEFRGDPDELIDRYFDAFVHVASWGMHQLMFRIPKRQLDVKTVKPYTTGENCWMRTTRNHVVIGFRFEDEEGGWEEEGGGWLDALINLRADLIAGDHRTLYLGWLIGLETGEAAEDAKEPPVPSGLTELTPALESFAEFFRIDASLIEAAGTGGAEVRAPGAKELEKWIDSLEESKKDSLLLSVAAGEGEHVRAELIRLYESSAQAKAARAKRPPPRTAGQLRALAESRASSGKTKRGREKLRNTERLESREAESWRQVDALIESEEPENYKDAVEILSQLRNLSAATGHSSRFAEHILAIRRLYAKNEELMALMDDTQLGERAPAKKGRAKKG